MKQRLSDHLLREIEYNGDARSGRAPRLAERDPVPGCRCHKCGVFDLHARGKIDPGVADLLLTSILPKLAERLPSERAELARRLREEWAVAAMIVLPDEEQLVELAARVEGARREPHRTPNHLVDLPIEAARRASIVAVCEHLGIAVRRAGMSWRGRCPFHKSESGTSFSVDPAKGLYHCFGCAAGGDVIDLYRRVAEIDFPTAVRVLAGLSSTVRHAGTRPHPQLLGGSG